MGIHPPETAGVLSRGTIADLIARDPPLVGEYLDLEQQLQPNGFDVTIRAAFRYPADSSGGRIGISDDDREIPASSESRFAADDWMELQQGPHLITFNEVVNLPRHIMALARPRSSLLRSGVTIHTAVWDAGYSGRSQALLIVHHPVGFRIQRNARIAQLVFMYLDVGDALGYTGRYQHENL